MSGSNLNTNAFLFAAGLGTRLRPATNEHPKPVLPLLSVPLGYYTLPYLESLSVTSYTANTYYLPEQVEKLYRATNLQFGFSREDGFIRGSAGGLKFAEKCFTPGLPILAINADEVFFTSNELFLREALTQHLSSQSLATLIVTRHPEAGKKFGAIWADNGRVVGIGKESVPGAQPFHFVGAQFINPRLLTHLDATKESNIFYDALIYRLAEGVQIYDLDCTWFEIGNLEDYRIAKAEISQQLALHNPIFNRHYNKLKKWPNSKLRDLT
jgi:mannose-1-phosphate guanylyltransferase